MTVAAGADFIHVDVDSCKMIAAVTIEICSLQNSNIIKE